MTADGGGPGDGAPEADTGTGPESERAAAEQPPAPEGTKGRSGPQRRKQVLLRLDPVMHDALARWAADELRSTNAQIDYLLRRALKEAGRLPKEARPHPRRGRPPNSG
ncbi:AT hook motif protein [Streptomyces sp. NPDC006990]|uniref:AT hook motif protein n=1 Tax=Streptomyces sp. NPDC006990 TaxID=3154481 RepID=UPI0034549C02